MKKSIFVVLFLLPALSNAATLICQPGLADKDYSAGIIDKLQATCEDQDSHQSLRLNFSGYGPGGRYGLKQPFSLQCPSLNYRQLPGTYHGLKIDFEFAFDLKGGLFYGNKTHCWLRGDERGILGGSLAGGTMEITPLYEE
jgi:hypothetical protein